MIINLDNDTDNTLDSEIIKFYQSNQSNKIKDALYHGYKIVTSNNYALNLHNSETNSANKIQELIKQIESIKSEQSVRVQELNDNYRAINTKQKNEFDLEKNSLLETISELKKEILISRNNMLDTQIEIENKIGDKFNQQITSLTNKNEELSNKLINNELESRTYYDTKEREFKTEIQEYKSELKDLRIKLEERNSILSNSSKKGKEGEVRMEEILNSIFPNAEIYDTHKMTANGDFRIIINGIQILYENKNFGSNNVSKRDIEKFRRDVEESDCHCGIICSENSGIASKDDLSIEIIGKTQKPAIFLHNTNTNIDKIRIAVLILCNILENKLDLNTSTLKEIKDLVSHCDDLVQIKNSNKKNIDMLANNNEKLGAKIRKIKYKLEQIIEELSSKVSGGDDNVSNENSAVKTKTRREKCEYCMKWYVKIQDHYTKCPVKIKLENEELTN